MRKRGREKSYMAVVFYPKKVPERIFVWCEDMIDNMAEKFADVERIEIYKWRGDIKDYKYLCTIIIDM